MTTKDTIEADFIQLAKRRAQMKAYITRTSRSHLFILAYIFGAQPQTPTNNYVRFRFPATQSFPWQPDSAKIFADVLTHAGYRFNHYCQTLTHIAQTDNKVREWIVEAWDK